MNVATKSTPGPGAIGARCLTVGVVYALASALVAIILGPLSRLSATIDNLLVLLFAETIVCLTLSPFILHSRRSLPRTILAVWAALSLISSIGLGIEGYLFKPTSAQAAVTGAAFGVLLNLLVAWLSVLLLMRPGQGTSEVEETRRTWWGWTWRVLLVGLAYLVFYFVFGAVNAGLYTLRFYRDFPQYGLALPAMGTILMAQLIRGPLFGLGSLLMIRSVNASRRNVALWTGLFLFVIGGAAPYAEQTFRTMPLGFNLATLTEIFFQNFLTGVVAAYLYRMQSPAERPSGTGDSFA